MAAETAPRSPLAKIVDVLFGAALVVLLLIVLLPLFWMVLTAFKVKGTAFQLDFIPRTTLYLPPTDQPAFDLPVVAEGQWYFHAETAQPEATNVELLLQPRSGATPQTHSMARFTGGVWAATIGPLPEEAITYAFVINGEKESISAEKENERAYDPANQLVLQRGLEPSALVYRDDENVRATVRGDRDSEYSLLLNDKRIIPMKPEGTAFTALAPAQGETHFRILQKRGVSAAIESKYTLDNFRTILTSSDFNFARFFFNSLVVATSAGLLTVFICTLAGYAFAVKRFHYREAIFRVLLLSMLVPGMIYMVPQFSITLSLGLMNTYAGMVVPHLANVFGLFLLRQYIGQIPRDLFAAAEVDGAREHQVFSNVVIPVCLPIMVTLFLLVFVGQWSNFLWQLIINTGTSDVLTLPVGLQQFKGQNANDWEKIMAGACFSLLPIAALFLSMQKYFLEGLTAGSVKE